jgi:hypothetical protein
MTMPMGRLRTDSLQSYIRAEADPEALCLFLHVPKTAGSSLGNEIAAGLQPYRNISLDYLDASLPHAVKRQRAVDDFVAELARGARFRSASGHITMEQALQIKRAWPRTKIVTFLRDPVDRVISDYRYQRTPAHPLHEAFIARYPTIADYVQARESRNKMLKRLGVKPADGAGAAIESMERHVAFIGLVEMYPLSVNVMFRLFGLDVLPSRHVRRTEDTGENRVEVTPELKARIGELNRGDAAIYDHVRSLLERHEAEWEALRGAAA